MTKAWRYISVVGVLAKSTQGPVRTPRCPGRSYRQHPVTPTRIN